MTVQIINYWFTKMIKLKLHLWNHGSIFMSIITIILAILVGLEFVYIMYLETFATSSNRTARVFKLSLNDLQSPIVQTLFKNQGIYNGLITLLILVALLYQSTVALEWLMIYIIAVAIYGSFTSNPKIIFLQGWLPTLTLLSIWMFN